MYFLKKNLRPVYCFGCVNLEKNSCFSFHVTALKLKDVLPEHSLETLPLSLLANNLCCTSIEINKYISNA